MTTYAQIYCTVQDVINDMGLAGEDSQLYERVRMASDFIRRRIGFFIPITETRHFGVERDGDLLTTALLAVTSISNNGVTVSDYDLHPVNRMWGNGPYVRIEQASAWADDDDVEIAGRWGLYEETEAMAVSAVTQLLADTTLVVSNGSKVSPGMVVLVEAEQELVTGWSTATAATSKLNGALGADAEEVTVDNGAEFNAGEVIQVSTEDLYIRMIRGNVLVTKRGWNGTTRASHSDDSGITVSRTATVMRGVNGTTAAAHTSKAPSRYVVPWDVNWLVRQIAGLMRMKALSGFAGKTGNAELGETFYFNEFPSQIKQIERLYRIVEL
jgi:hypothetical protein